MAPRIDIGEGSDIVAHTKKYSRVSFGSSSSFETPLQQ